MSWVFALFVLCLVVALSLAVAAVKRRQAILLGNYRATKPLSDPEQSLYWRLREAMPE